MNLRDEIFEIDTSPKKLREFGLLIGGIFLAIAGLLFWKQRPAYPVFLLLGGLLFVCGLVRPSWLKYLYRAWMTLALIMGWVMSRVILSVLYYFVITPIGVMTHLAGKDFLDLKFRENKASYWLPKKPEENAKEACERQF